MRLDIRIPGLVRDARAFTRLEFGLLTAMLGAMIINGIASLGGGLGNGHRPIGNAEQADMPPVTHPAAPATAAPVPVP